MSKILGLNLKTIPAMRGIPDVLRLFPVVDPILPFDAMRTDIPFRDTAYSGSGVRTYKVSAIDLKGREGTKARVEVPPVTLAVSGYGTYQDPVVSESRNDTAGKG